MLIAQISDSHLRARGVRVFGAVDTYGALERAVGCLLRLDPLPDAVIHTGDLVNDGDEKDHAALAGLLGKLPMPVYVVPGNHDRRDILRRHLALAGEGPIRHCADPGEIRLIGLDSQVEGSIGGRLGAEQLQWLDDRLAEAPDRPALVFLHHPPFATGVGFMDGHMLEDHAAFARTIARHRQVELVTCGHVHRPVQTRFAGTIAMIAPAVAHQVVLDMTPDAPLRWVPEPAAMLLHRWTREWGFASHLAYIDRHGDDAPFSGHTMRIEQ